MDFDAFNTALAKLIKSLKKDVGASHVRQGYKGTGAQKHRRQMFVRFADDSATDLWLDSGYLGTVGVVMGKVPRMRISYEGKTPEQVYQELLQVLRESGVAKD